MGFKLKSKRKISPGSKSTNFSNQDGVKKAKLTELDLQAIEELERTAKRQASTGTFSKSTTVINKRYFINSLASVERHNAKTKSVGNTTKNLTSQDIEQKIEKSTTVKSSPKADQTLVNK